MQRLITWTKWPLTVAAVVLSLVVAVVWPWPAPVVDWRTPFDQALANSDCRLSMKIAVAAASAGANGAMESLRQLEQNTACRDTPTGDTTDIAFLSVYRHTNQTSDSIYGLSANDLGLLRRRYVSAAIFLCVTPYNGLSRIDNAELSRTVPNDGEPIMALHRYRRETCLAFLEFLTGNLVDANDASASDVADRLLTTPPLQKTPQAGFLYARLLLEKAFVSTFIRDATTPDKQSLIRTMRDFAWLRLKKAASAGHEPAIRLTIALLHEGRFTPRDDKEAYFWILRLRRIGGASDAIASTVEASLPLTERDAVRQKEEMDWSGPVLFH